MGFSLGALTPFFWFLFLFFFPYPDYRFVSFERYLLAVIPIILMAGAYAGMIFIRRIRSLKAVLSGSLIGSPIVFIVFYIFLLGYLLGGGGSP